MTPVPRSSTRLRSRRASGRHIVVLGVGLGSIKEMGMDRCAPVPGPRPGTGLSASGRSAPSQQRCRLHRSHGHRARQRRLQLRGSTVSGGELLRAQERLTGMTVSHEIARSIGGGVVPVIGSSLLGMASRGPCTRSPAPEDGMFVVTDAREFISEHDSRPARNSRAGC